MFEREGIILLTTDPVLIDQVCFSS